MNLVLLLVVISQVCLGVCAWLSPGCLRWVSAHLLARAEAIDAAKEMSERRLRYWRGELGLDREVLESEGPALRPVRQLARQ
jgi:hypothetical protein